MVRRARVQIALRLPYEMVAALRALRATTGVGVTSQIEQAVQAYLDRTKKSGRKRADTRRRPSTRQQR